MSVHGAVLTGQSPENGRLQKKSYDIDSKDFFWDKNAPNPFPQVAEDIDMELGRCVRTSHLR